MKKKVYLFSDGNYSDVVFENIDAILEWIKADTESNYTEVGEEFSYTIKIAEMTEEELANLPEAH